MAVSAAAAVVLGPLHVSCFVTAANRATPVFDVQPDRKCVRVVTKATPPAVHGHVAASSSLVSSSSSSSVSTSVSLPSSPHVASVEPPSVEWDFHAVFSPATHTSAFFRDITLPALHSVVADGVNANILATGIHPTQKFRFLFGKSTSASAATATTPNPVSLDQSNEKDVLDLHGQLGGLLFEFFEHVAASGQLADWAVGLSSWILVNNEAVDLLQPSPTPTAPDMAPKTATSRPAPLTFTSMEAATFTDALQILQTAKTHRIVRKHTAEHSHFFVRLAFFHRPSGQLSTLHVVELMDLKDFGDDAVSTQEKSEFYEILHEIRQQTNAMATASATASPRPKPCVLSPGKRTMLLSNFLQPLLTQNARTFLYANVIDSRASLRESVALLNAVANLKGFACVCKRLTGVAFEQLGFQSPPSLIPACSPDTEAALDSAAAKALAAVAIGESLLHRLSSVTSCSSVIASPSTKTRDDLGGTPELLPSSPVVTSDAMSWLEAFKQRKKDILAGTVAGPSMAPVACTRSPTVVASAVDDLPLGLPDRHALRMPVPSSTRSSGSSSDLYARLMETIELATSHPSPAMATTTTTSTTATTAASLRMHLRRSNSMPLPIEDPMDDLLPPPPLPQPQPSHSHFDLAARLTETLASHSHKPDNTPSTGGFVRYSQPQGGVPRSIPSPATSGWPSQAMAAPNVDGLDAATAAKIQATDASLLRKNYDALLAVVREQQQLREAAEARATELAHDHEELRAQHDVQLENLKLEAVALKSKVRLLERQSGVSHVFDQYERELQSLQRELQELRMQNVELELRLVSASAARDSGSRSNSSSRGDVMAALQSPGPLGGPGSLTELKKRYQAMPQDKLELERQLADLRKKERQFQAQSKLIHESTRKADRLARELSERDDVLTSTRLGKKRLSAEVVLAQQETQQLQQENERLLLEKAATTELLAAKMYLASVESEQKKAEILDKFVRKHGDRMQRLRGTRGGSDSNNNGSWTDVEGWRRNAEARETEEKLFQGLKLRAPQLVPLANKVLRKLELQELSLREFAEREVDFINLLVELASDQPALALKTMIDDEMKKLALL